MSDIDLKSYIEYFYKKGIDFEVVWDGEKKLVLFKCPVLLKRTVAKDFLLKYKKEFPSIENENELIDAIAAYLIRENILIDEKFIRPKFFNKRREYGSIGS